jgi:hypothetical protein
MGRCALTRSPGRSPSLSGLFSVTESDGPPPGVRWRPASRGMKTQQRSVKPTSAPLRSAPGGGMMPAAAWCARTASGTARACGSFLRWYSRTTHRPVAAARRPVTRGLAGSVPCGQRCPRGTRTWRAIRTGGCGGHTCSPRSPAAATAGTHRHLALPRARLAVGTARARQVSAVSPGTGQPPPHPPSAAGMTAAGSRASKTTAMNRSVPGLGDTCCPPIALSLSVTDGDPSRRPHQRQPSTARRRRRPTSARAPPSTGPSHVGAVKPGACLENGPGLPAVTGAPPVPTLWPAPIHRSESQRSTHGPGRRYPPLPRNVTMLAMVQALLTRPIGRAVPASAWPSMPRPSANTTGRRTGWSAAFSG